MLKRLIFVGSLILLIAGIAWSAEDSFPLPGDMQKLMPADAALVVGVASINELDRQWKTLEDMLDSEDGEGTDILGYLAEDMPQLAEYADPDRPLAVLMGLPDLMGGEEPAFTFIIPLNENFDEAVLAELDEEGVIHFREGDYLAFSLDPNFLPAGAAPELALGLADGFITASLDLEKVIGAYRPLAEMGLGAMGNSVVVPDSAAIANGAPPPMMNSEELAAIQDLARSLMDSARRFDLALAIEGEEVTMHTGFSVQPGSPLDPGPQPPFENALQLTWLLPEGGNIIQTMALDQTRQFEVFRGFYLASTEKAIAHLPAEQADAYRAWIESYLDSLDLFAQPLAASIGMSETSMSANMVMECEDATASLNRFAALFDGLSNAGIGMTMKKMPNGKIAETEVRSWTIEYDVEQLAKLSADPLNPSLGGTGRMQAEQMIAILRKVTPNLNLAVRGDYLILSADSNPANLAHMIQMAGQSRGAAHPATAAVAAKAGPGCQQVVTGDLMAILAWVTEWMEELEDEEFAAIEGHPIPFSAAYTIDGADYGLQWTMDMPAVKRFAAAVRQMEEMDDRRKAAADEEKTE